MKKFLKSLITITMANVVFCSIGEAQEKFIQGLQTVYGKTFKVTFSKSFDIISVDSRLSIYKDGYPQPQSPTPPLPIRSGDMEVDTVVDRNIFFDILESKLKALNANKEMVIINYVFDHDGDILDISSYGLPKNTLITPKELAVIDKRLRNEVKATFKGREYLEHPVIFYGREIRF